MVTLNQIQKFVIEIAESYQPDKIYLFGSYANNTAMPDSDIDLFIIKNVTTNHCRIKFCHRNHIIKK